MQEANEVRQANMQSQLILLALLSVVAATPIPSTLNYGDWSNWQTWYPTWLSTIAPQISCSTADTRSPISPTACANCSQADLVTFFMGKWQPYVDTVFTNLASHLSNLSITESHVTDVLNALKTQFAGDLISTIEYSLYSPQPTSSSSTLVKRHGNSTGHPLAQSYQNYTYQGCMTNFASKALVQSENTNFGNLTNEKCIDYCRNKGYSIAGTQSGSQCFCGNTLTSTTLVIDENACATSCTGDNTQVCGDNQKLSVYATYNVSGTTFNRTSIRSNWEEVGCVSDGVGNHSLTGAEYACLGMTVEMCMDFCDVLGFPVAGLEYGGECYCGTTFENGGGRVLEGVMSLVLEILRK